MADEVLRGRLNIVRHAEAGRSKISVDLAHQLFEEAIRDLRGLQILSYTSEAEVVYQRLREKVVRISTHDLRIAAICQAYGVNLISRNRRDFEQVPGLAVEFWT